MESILSKTDIADLLKAIHEGTVSLDLHEGEQEQFLECSPVNLFQMAKPDSEQFRIPNFDIILDAFCRAYATGLTNQLQKTFSINRTSLETYEFKEFMSSQSTPGAIGILDLNPLKQGALIIYDPKLSFSMIEIMLGSSPDLEPLQMDRWLTPIELTVVKSITPEACSALDKAFSQLLELNSSLLKIENNARLVSIVEPESEVIVGTFVVKVGELSGEIHLVFPFATLEPLREQLKELLNISTATRSTWQDVLEDEIKETAASLTAQSGTMTMSINKLMQIKKGDILHLNYDPNSPLKILVEGKVKFSAIPGTHNGKKAISLIGVYK